MELAIIILGILLALVLIVLTGVIVKVLERPQQFTTNYYGTSPAEMSQEEPVQVQFGFPEELIANAELVFDEVPVFVRTEDTSQHVGFAVFFMDEGRVNALVEVLEDHTEFFKAMTKDGLNGLSIAPVSPPEPTPEFKIKEEENNHG